MILEGERERNQKMKSLNANETKFQAGKAYEISEGLYLVVERRTEKSAWVHIEDTLYKTPLVWLETSRRKIRHIVWPNGVQTEMIDSGQEDVVFATNESDYKPYYKTCPEPIDEIELPKSGTIHVTI